MSSDITGIWEFSITDGSPEAFDFDFDQFNVFFSDSPIMFEIGFPLSDSVYTVDATNNNCTNMEGNYNNAAGIAGPEDQVINGTFTATRIS